MPCLLNADLGVIRTLFVFIDTTPGYAFTSLLLDGVGRVAEALRQISLAFSGIGGVLDAWD